MSKAYEIFGSKAYEIFGSKAYEIFGSKAYEIFVSGENFSPFATHSEVKMLQLWRLKSKSPSMIVLMYHWNSTKQRLWPTSEQWHICKD